jgi:very-short-patch-repair endonuclease
MAQRARELRQEMTEAETALWQALRRGQLDGYHFRRQQVIDGCIVDFYCHTAGLVIEVDGPVHAQQREQDQERDILLAQRGLHVLRFSNTDVLEHLDRILALIRQHFPPPVSE